MQDTRYLDKNGNEKVLTEYFEPTPGDSETKLREKMNHRLFELEAKGHSLVSQRPATLAEKIAYDRAKKAKEKLRRMDKASA